MKNVNEIKAEVFRRSDERIKRRKQLQRNIIAMSIPAAVCLVLAFALLIQKISMKQHAGKPDGYIDDMTAHVEETGSNGEKSDIPGSDNKDTVLDNSSYPQDENEEADPLNPKPEPPNTSKVPGSPNTPNNPNTPNDPVVSDAPGYVPNTPNIPDTPDEPNNPGVSNDPINSGDPNIPHSPDEPNAPGSDEPNYPDEPGSPYDPGDTDEPNMGSSNPEEKEYTITFVDENGEETVYTLIGNVLISEDGTRRILTDEELIRLKEYFGLD